MTFNHVYFYDDQPANIRSAKNHLKEHVTCFHVPKKLTEKLTLDKYNTNTGEYINGISLADIQQICTDPIITDSLFAFDWDDTISCVDGVSYPPLGLGNKEISFDDERSLVFWPKGLEGYLASIMGGPERLAAVREMITRLIANNNTVVILTNNESSSIYGSRGTRPLFIEMVKKLHPALALISSYTNYPTLEVNEETGEFEYASTKGKVLSDYIANKI
jgi:hypothetical protein